MAEGETRAPGDMQDNGTSRAAPSPARALQRAAAVSRGPGLPGSRRKGSPRPAAAFPGRRRLLPEEREGPRARRSPGNSGVAASSQRETSVRAAFCARLPDPPPGAGEAPRTTLARSCPRRVASKRRLDGGMGSEVLIP